MKKFEEEVKRPSNAGIDPFSKRDVSFEKLSSKFTKGAQTLKEWKEYAFKAEDKIRELESQLKKQQPEIPECVAEFIENYDDINETSLLYIMKDFVESNHWDVFCEIPDNLKKYGRWDDMLYKAIRFGYTVAKEKRFYLKHIDFCKRHKDYDWYMIKYSDGPLNHLRVEKGTLPLTVDTYFTQQEIDSMETGSYEQIEVEK